MSLYHCGGDKIKEQFLKKKKRYFPAKQKETNSLLDAQEETHTMSNIKCDSTSVQGTKDHQVPSFSLTGSSYRATNLPWECTSCSGGKQGSSGGGCVAVGQQPDQYRRERLLGCSDTQQSQMSSCAQWGKKPGRNTGSQPLPKPSAWRECIYFQGYPWCSEATHLWTLFFISIYNVGKMRWKMK